MQQLLFVLLGIEAIEDIRSRTIRMDLIYVFAALGIILQFIRQEMKIGNLIAGCAVGAVLLVLSKYTSLQMGEGDGWILMVTGIYLGGWSNLALCYYSLILAAVVGSIWILIRKVRNKETTVEMPFVPYVLGVYLVLWYRGV